MLAAPALPAVHRPLSVLPSPCPSVFPIPPSIRPSLQAPESPHLRPAALRVPPSWPFQSVCPCISAPLSRPFPHLCHSCPCVPVSLPLQPARPRSPVLRAPLFHPLPPRARRGRGRLVRAPVPASYSIRCSFSVQKAHSLNPRKAHNSVGRRIDLWNMAARQRVLSCPAAPSAAFFPRRVFSPRLELADGAIGWRNRMP